MNLISLCWNVFRYSSLEESKNDEVQHLQERISTLEQRHSQATLQETDKVQALMKEVQKYIYLREPNMKFSTVIL